MQAPELIRIARIDSPTPDHWWPIDSRAVERFCVPYTGPTLWLLTRVVAGLHNEGRSVVTAGDLTALLGMRTNAHRLPMMLRRADRLRFGRWHPAEGSRLAMFELARAVPPPSTQQRRLLPAWLAAEIQNTQPLEDQR